MRVQQRLLDAHVAFVVRELTGEAFAALVRSEIDWLLGRAEQIPLDDVADREAVTAVAVKYATRVDLPGAIPEIVGEIAGRLRAHPVNARRLDEIVPRARAEAVAAKLAELQPLRRWFGELIAQSPVVQVWLADYLRSIALWPVAANRRLANRVPGADRALALGERLAGGPLGAADLRTRELAENAAAALPVWDQPAGRPVRDLLGAGDDADLIDLVVLAFETWLELRDGDYVTALIEMGVDFFFDTYGRYPLSELLDEFGIERADLFEEAMRFGPRALTALAANGDLEAFVRRQLARFYDSVDAQAALDDA